MSGCSSYGRTLKFSFLPMIMMYFRDTEQSLYAHVAEGYRQLFGKEVGKEPLRKKEIVIARKNVSNPFMMWPIATLVATLSSRKERKEALGMDAALTARILIPGVKV